jgi:predicted nucleotide-binding protein
MVGFGLVKQTEENGEDDESRRSPRPYPRHTLEQALVIAQALQDKNAGKPMKRIFVADAIGRKPGSSEFKFLLSSSAKYGLTSGTEKADYVELTVTGQEVTKPRSNEERLAALQKAVLAVETFKKIFEHYKDAKLPTEEFFKNVLEREFGIPHEWVNDCISTLTDNGKYSGIIRDVSGSPFIVLGEFDVTAAPAKKPVTEGTQEETGEPTAKPPELTKKIFVAHGKNKTPLEQLKGILDQFKIPYTVAVDEPHKGRPISAKVAELMRECGSAVFIFTADEEYTDANGTKSYRPSDNVVYELGAATVLYGNRIVIFKEEGTDFASDFKDFGYITFEKDNIAAKAMDLLKELVALGFLKVTPT